MNDTIFDTKVAIVLREDLMVWRTLNAAGNIYGSPPIQPVIVLACGKEQLSSIHRRALEPGGSRYTREFWVPHRSGIVRIAARDIDLIEAERDYMRLNVGPRSFLLRETITELERQLDPAEFVRLHRSTMVRRDRITGFRRNGRGAWEAEMAGGRLLRVGRTYLAKARAMAVSSGLGKTACDERENAHVAT